MNILRIIYYIILTHQWACFICLVHIGKFLKWTDLACFSFLYLSLACLFWHDTLISIFYRECTSCNYILEEVNFAFFINPMCTSTPDLFVLQSFVIIYIIPSFTLALLSMTWQPVINLVHMQVNFRGTRFFHERDVRDSTLPTKYRNIDEFFSNDHNHILVQNKIGMIGCCCKFRSLDAQFGLKLRNVIWWNASRGCRYSSISIKKVLVLDKTKHLTGLLLTAYENK